METSSYQFTIFKPNMSKLLNTKIERRDGNNSDCVYSLLEYLDLITADQASILRKRKKSGYVEIIIHLLRMKYPDYYFEFLSYDNKELFLKDLKNAISVKDEMAVVVYNWGNKTSHINLVSQKNPNFYYCYDPQLNEAIDGVAPIQPGTNAVSFQILVSYKK